MKARFSLSWGLSVVVASIVLMAKAQSVLAEPARIFRSVLPRLQQQTNLPIVLPTQLPSGLGPIAVRAEGNANRYEINLESQSDCLGANVCFVGGFYAERGGNPSDSDPDETVTLTRGIRGYYAARSCGASCTPPEIAWVSNGVLYSIQMRLPSTEYAANRDALVRMANSAIEDQ